MKAYKIYETIEFRQSADPYKTLRIGKKNNIKNNNVVAFAEEELITERGRTENKAVTLIKIDDYKYEVETSTDGGYEWGKFEEYDNIDDALDYFYELVGMYNEIELSFDITK